MKIRALSKLLLFPVFAQPIAAFEDAAIPVRVMAEVEALFVDISPCGNFSDAFLQVNLNGQVMQLHQSGDGTNNDEIVTMLVPGKKYWMSVSGSGTKFFKGSVDFKPPPGYVVEGAVNLSNIPTQCEWTGGSIGSVRLLPHDGSVAFPASSLPSSAVGKQISLNNTDHQASSHPSAIEWSFGLGHESNGNPISTIGWNAELNHSLTEIPADLFALSNLHFDRNLSREVDINYSDTDETIPYQIRSFTALVEITSLSGGATGFTIKYYDPENYTDDPFDTTYNTQNTYAKKGSATPYCVFEVRRLSSTKYRVVKQFESEPTPLVYEYERLVSPAQWSLKIGAATSGTYNLNTSAILAVHEETFSLVSTDVTDALLVIRNATGGPVIHELRRRIDGTGAYPRVTKRVLGETDYPTTKLETNYTYYTTGDQYLKSTLSYTGGWNAHNYDSDGRIVQTLSPFLDTPSTPTTNPSGFSGQLVGIVYADQATVVIDGQNHTVTNETSRSKYFPAGIVEKIGAQVVGKRISSFEFSSSQQEPDTVLTIIKSFANASTSFEGITLEYDTKQLNPSHNSLRGLPIWKQSTDGRVTYSRYERGTLNSSKTSPAPSWSGTSSGLGWRTVVYHGTVHSAAAIDGVAPVLFTDGGNTPFNLYLVPNKSTMVTTYRDGRRIVTETAVYTSGTTFETVSWEFQEYSYNGKLLFSKDSVGLVYEVALFDNGRVVSATESDGVVFDYTYDALGRVTGAYKLAFAGFSETLTEFAYDARGRVTGTVFQSLESGETENLSTASLWDKSGFKIQDALQCGKVITYTRELINGDYRKIKRDEDNNRIQYTSTHRDGRTLSIAGPGIVDEFYSYSVTGGMLRQYKRGPEDGSSNHQFIETDYDWTGRIVRTRAPSAQDSFDLITDLTYFDEQATDKHKTAKLKASLLIGNEEGEHVRNMFDYSLLGSLAREGLDADHDGVLSTVGTDRIIDHQSGFVKDAGTWWTETAQWVYYLDNSSSSVFLSRQRNQLTGLSGNTIGNTKVWQPHGSITDGISDAVTIVTETLDKANRKITRTVNVPTGSNNRVEIVQNRYRTQITESSGEKLGYYYDYLGRLKKVLHGSNTPGVTTDKDFEVHLGYVANTTVSAWEKQLAADGSATLVTTRSLQYEDCGSGLVSEESISYTRNGSNVTESSYYRYSDLKQLTHVWGNASSPVMYEYDAYGRRTKMHTYSAGSGWDSASFPQNDFNNGSLRRTTEWVFDWSTGAFKQKKDPANVQVEWAHDWANRPVSFNNARGDPVEFEYHARTGELYKRKHGAVDKVTYTYTRAGLLASVADDTGTRTFAYRSHTEVAPLTLKRETLPSAFYGNNNTVTNNVNWKGHFTGVDLGTSTNSMAVSRAAWSYLSTTGLLHSIRTQVPSKTDYTYPQYEPGTSIVRGFSNYLPTEGTYFYHVRDLMERRSLVDTVTNHLGSSATAASTTFAAYALTHNDKGRIESIARSGTMYSGYGAWGTLRSDYAYDDQGQLSDSGEFTENSAHQDAFLFDRRRDYRYDRAGNRTKTANKYNTWAKYNSPGGSHVSDDLDRYTRVESHTQEYYTGFEPNAGTVLWAYDNENAVWDWTRRPGEGQHFYIEYETAPRTDQGGDPIDFQRWFFANWTNPNWNGFYYIGSPQEPLYDLDGNMTWDGPASGSGLALVYEYDRENRLTAVLDDKYRIEFTYDYMNRRVRQIVKDRWDGDAVVSTHLYVYHGYHLIAEYAETGSTITPARSYTWGPDISGAYGGAGGIGGLWLIEDFATGRSYIPGYDHQGNVMLLYQIAHGSTGNTGHVVAEYEYDPFGQLVRETGWDWDAGAEEWVAVGGDPVGNPFRYQTKWNIAETGVLAGHYNDRNFQLYDYGLRFYLPRLGRFINRDPIAEAGGTNLYAFVGNDPVNRVDFLGLDMMGVDLSSRMYRPYAYDDNVVDLPEFPVETGACPGIWVGDLCVEGVDLVYDNNRLVWSWGDRESGSGADHSAPGQGAGAQGGDPDCDKLRGWLRDAQNARAAYGEKPPALGYQPVMHWNEESGMGATLFRGPDGTHHQLAYRGSHNAQDWIANGQNLFGFPSGQFNDAVNVAQFVFNSFDNVSFTGHSQAGAQASLGAMAVGGAAVAFNSAGLSRGTLRHVGVSASGAASIANVSTSGDLLTVVQHLPGIHSPIGSIESLKGDTYRNPSYRPGRPRTRTRGGNHSMDSVISLLEKAIERDCL
jgi:RHS repeat-associated protein